MNKTIERINHKCEEAHREYDRRYPDNCDDNRDVASYDPDGYNRAHALRMPKGKTWHE